MYGAPVHKEGTNGMAIAALVCSLAGLLLWGVPAVLGVIFGFVAHSQIRRTGQAGSGLATAGIVVGFVVIALVLVAVIVLVALAHTCNTVTGTC